MTTAVAPTRFTPDDLLRLEEQGLYELVNGRLVEKQMSSLANEAAGRITIHLGAFVLQSSAGKMYPEQSFQCFPFDLDLIRRPDVAFIRAERLSGVPEEGHVPIAPDLAIEVLSPNDKVYELEKKVTEYRAAGVKLVWIVHPKLRWIRVFRPDRGVTELSETDTITGEGVLPGFSVVVKDLLPIAVSVAP